MVGMEVGRDRGPQQEMVIRQIFGCTGGLLAGVAQPQRHPQHRAVKMIIGVQHIHRAGKERGQRKEDREKLGKKPSGHGRPSFQKFE